MFSLFDVLRLWEGPSSRIRSIALPCIFLLFVFHFLIRNHKFQNLNTLNSVAHFIMENAIYSPKLTSISV